MKKILIITWMALFIALFINSKTVLAQQIEPELRPPEVRMPDEDKPKKNEIQDEPEPRPTLQPPTQFRPEKRPPEVPKPDEDKPKKN